MNYEFLSRLYWACADENQMLGAGMNFSELYERTEEAGAALGAFDEYMKRYSVDEQNEVYDLKCDLFTAYEKQGFINGFRIAMMMGQELAKGEYPILGIHREQMAAVGLDRFSENNSTPPGGRCKA